MLICVISCFLAWLSEKYGDVRNLSFSDSPSIVAGWNLLSLIARSAVGASVMVAGNVFAYLRPRMIKFSESGKKKLITGTAFLFLGGLLGFLNYDCIDLHFAFIRNPVLFYSSAGATTAGLVMIGTVWNHRVLNWLGRNSLYIMFFQIIQYYWCWGVNAFFSVRDNSIFVQYGIAFFSLALILFLAVCGTQIMLKYDLIHIYQWRKKKDA